MSIRVHTLWNVDESSFGLGGLSSHDADVAAAYQQEPHPAYATEGSADEAVDNSYGADIDAGFDNPAVTPDGSGLPHAD